MGARSGMELVELMTRCGCTRTIEISRSMWERRDNVAMEILPIPPPCYVAEAQPRKEKTKREFKWDGLTTGYTRRRVYVEVLE